MMRYALRLALPGSILLASFWLGLVFRYDMQVWGATVLVHDRWRGTVERCVGNDTTSRCRPLLGAGMQPVQQRLVVLTPAPSAPRPAKVPRKMSDQEFNALMSRAMEVLGDPPQGGPQ